MGPVAKKLIIAGRKLADELRSLEFSEPVAATYLTVDYAQDGYESYLKKFGDSEKKVLFLGMNPGPYGMAQTGVPFGEIPAVRDWMGLSPKIGQPENPHPKRPITGFDCTRSEVSGKRLWGLFSEVYPRAEDFFNDHLVINFCPLIWMKDTGANLTPDKLKREEMKPVDAACQAHLVSLVKILHPEHLVGVGAYAEKQLQAAAKEAGYEGKIGKILHPSPASPAANRGWPEVAIKQLNEQAIWK